MLELHCRQHKKNENFREERFLISSIDKKLYKIKIKEIRTSRKKLCTLGY